MSMRTRILSSLLAVFAATAVPATWTDAAAAAEGFERREGARPRSRDWIERFRIATPEMRDAQRRRALERLAEATPAERRRVLRRQRRIMRFLPEQERRKLRRERREFAEQYGLDTSQEREGWNTMREFDFTPDERRILRARVRRLTRSERRELRDKILHMRDLPEDERQILRERLHEMKSLSEEERRAFKLNTRRWKQMSEEKRDALRAQMKRIRSLPPDERLELLERAQRAAELSMD